MSAKWNKNALTRLVFKATQNPVYKFADKRFAEYRKIVKVTDKEYNSEQELAADIPQADIYMTGSDQVWNTVVCGEIDPVYFLSFLPDSAKKIAYAASFGGSEVLPNDKENIKKWLKRYDKITIRENSGVKIANELGVPAEQVLDPTFCLKNQSGKSSYLSESAAKNMCLCISSTQTNNLTNTQSSTQRKRDLNSTD